MNAVFICGDFFGFAGFAKLLFYSVNAVFLSILFVQYARAYRALRSRVKGLFQGAATVNATQQRAPKKEFAKAVLLILSSALICYAPAFSYVTIIYMKPSLMSVQIYLSFLSLVAVNSLLNAIIFMALNQDIKRYMMQCVNYYFRHQELSSSQKRTEEENAA